MSNFVKSLTAYLPFQSCSSPRYFPKKDDDTGLENAKAWINANPIHFQTLKNLTISRSYGKTIIEGLKKFDIDSSNEDLVKAHLVEICKINNLVQQYLLDHIDDIKAEEKIRTSLYDTLSSTYPPNS